MSRTVAVNLFCGLLPIAVALAARFYEGFAAWVYVWVLVQLACWCGALVLLRYDTELLRAGVRALLLNFGMWIVALYLVASWNQSGQDPSAISVLGFGLAGLSAVVLRWDFALLDVQGYEFKNQATAIPQFQLTRLFALSAVVALCTGFYLLMHRVTASHPLVLMLEMLQLISWVWIADGMLPLKPRWKSSLFLCCLLGAAWVAYYPKQWFDRREWQTLWLPTQILVFVIPLLYRWAGWRIVPREMVEHLLYFADLKQTSPSERDGD